MTRTLTIALALIVLAVGSAASAAVVDDFSTDPASPWSTVAGSGDGPTWDDVNETWNFWGPRFAWLDTPYTLDVTGSSIDQAAYVRADVTFNSTTGSCFKIFAFGQNGNHEFTSTGKGYGLNSYSRPGYSRNEIFPDSRLTRLEGDAFLPLTVIGKTYTFELLMWQTDEGAYGTSYVKLNYYDKDDGGTLLDYALFKDDTSDRLTDFQNILTYNFAGDDAVRASSDKPLVIDNFEAGVVPEPATMGLLGLGGLALLRRRSRKA